MKCLTSGGESSGIPVKFVGVGEQIDDMEEFRSGEFIRALFE